jgi:hypothetical protein
MHELVRDAAGSELHNLTALPMRSAVVFREAVSDWPAVESWDLSRFEAIGSDLRMNVKTFNQGKQAIVSMTLKEYVRYLRERPERWNIRGALLSS